MSPTDSARGATVENGYRIRPYEPADLAGFLRLDSRVWDRTRSREWFRWKYADNPYTDHTPVFVADYDGEIVGARPFLAMPLRVDDRSVLAFQPADTMVDPNHRREGIFRRMTTRALAAYRDGEPALFFNFPNQHARPGYLDLGWRAVAPEVTYYRIETPTRVRGQNNGLGQRAADIARPLLRGYYGARRALSTPPDDLGVREVDGAPVELVAGLHDRRRPSTIHAGRTEQFLRWRLASPIWERRTYLVGDPPDEEPIAAVVARSRTTDDGLRLTQVIDVAPLSGGPRWQAALWRGLDAVIRTHPTTALFAVSDGAIPHRTLAAFGFLRDDSLPLSRLTTFDSMLVVRPNGDVDDETAWRVGGRAVDDPDNWCVTFAERDTS
ncbi:GNAT family N-acetyltransferase [Halohasta salina]|uniref:GNAT family N-acetyltransferase n=1 Tax=Halohasta salina TaxID=2961621 RepID=UPI0020A2A51C|nr:GNAT family N-acetyltransferase [Halohasta salina]